MAQQGLLAVYFSEASAIFVLLLTLILLFRSYRERYFAAWIFGWLIYFAYSLFALLNYWQPRPLWLLLARIGFFAGTLLLLYAVIEYLGYRRFAFVVPAFAVIGAVWSLLQAEYLADRFWAATVTTLLHMALFLLAGSLLAWRKWGSANLGDKILAAAFSLHGIHMVDSQFWSEQTGLLLRVSINGWLEVALGVGMAVLVLDDARARAERLNRKLNRINSITAVASQSLYLDEMLRNSLDQILETMAFKHGIIRLVEESPERALVARVWRGFPESFMQRRRAIPFSDPIAQAMERDRPLAVYFDDSTPTPLRQILGEAGVHSALVVGLRAKDRALGLLGIASIDAYVFTTEEIDFLHSVANQIGVMVENARLFSQVVNAQLQWMNTFDSIQDPILVHDSQNVIRRINRAFGERIGRTPSKIVGRDISEVFGTGRKAACRFCMALDAGEEIHEAALGGHFLVSTSRLADKEGQNEFVHVLRDISDRKGMEERYLNLFHNVQEGVFISTPAGRFVDFNEAFMRMLGYTRREELLAVDIVNQLYVRPEQREALKKLLAEKGNVMGYELDVRKKTGELIALSESSFAVRDVSGNIVEYQGFVLDVTEQKRTAEEIRRRNRELSALNSIASTLSQSLDLDEILGKVLRQVVELFSMDTGAIYLMPPGTALLERKAVLGLRSEFAHRFPPLRLPPDLLDHLTRAHTNVLTMQHLPFVPPIFREIMDKEGLHTTFLVILWSKDRIVGGLAVGSRSVREFSPADLSLLTAVANQIAAAVEKIRLYEETLRAYDDLRHTQEQLLQSEKMAAVGQLISGVAHELNNPLTAILGYSQLLQNNPEVGPKANEYTEKLLRQAQRTHRIVQNLLSFARQSKLERHLVDINRVIEDTITLREYDLKLNNVQVDRQLEAKLPATTGDPHQLQQVFLNILNNACDAIQQKQNGKGKIEIRTFSRDGHIIVEFADNGPGIKDPSKVFDPFYTTKAVGKGTGLGLSICYGIVGEHGGEISAENRKPAGALFRVRLPILTGGAKPVAAAASSLQEVPAGARILLVDDEEAVLELEQEILKGKLFSVLTARSGQEALAALERETVDLVVTDLKMPGEISGKDLFFWIQKHRPQLQQRFVLTMSDARQDEVRSLVEEHHIHYIQKPFNVTEFLAVVQRSLASPLEPAPAH
ncbi:MAG TPA: PAS domain S-box protein [Candidatus Acidoferrales bacterium]